MFKSNKLILAACFVIMHAASACAFTGGELPKRSDIPDEYKWNLSDIYATDADWEKDFAKIKGETPKIAAMAGGLDKSSKNLLSCLQLDSELSIVMNKLYAYANMKSHEDTTNPVYQALSDRAGTLGTELSAASSFITPEIIAIPEKRLKELMDDPKYAKDFNDYRFMIKEIVRLKAHVLSPREEILLAKAGNMADTPDNTFSMHTNADMRFPYIKDDSGKRVELTEERYLKYITSSKQSVRKAAFNALFETYGKSKNTLGATFNGMLKASRFYSEARKYDSDIARALSGSNIPMSVYDNLVDTIESNLAPLHRYMALRKKVLGLDELHIYDVYAPLVKNPYKDIPWEESKNIAVKSLQPLGADYMTDFEKALSRGWIDVYSNRGKRGGAYSWGVYSVHPFILLNYNGEFSDVMTTVHEMGHAMHSFYSNKHQPYPTSSYTIFCAEVASITNEELTMQHLLDTERDKKKRIYLLNQRLERMRTSVYRQVMFASFEREVHARSARGENTTADELCKIWKGLNEKYFGPDVIIDDGISMEWARIPHFYSPFYVYQYATSSAAAAALAKQILNEGAPARERYLEFLRSGGSDYSIELLKRAGVDMSTPKPVLDLIDIFSKTLDEMESLINQK